MRIKILGRAKTIGLKIRRRRSAVVARMNRMGDKKEGKGKKY